MNDFFRTQMGRIFFEGTMPKIAKALEQSTKQQKLANAIELTKMGLLSEVKLQEIQKEVMGE